jgi:shikimate dehydrogenase
MPDDVRDCELVVQATSVGMVGAPAASPIDADLLGPGQLLADLVYVPAETSLMKAARERGAEVIGGLGMLVHQASIAIERWTGSEAPVSEMWRAARSATAGR